MKLLVFTVFDKAVGAYLQPFFCRSKGEALRSFSDAVNDKSGQSNFAKYPADYHLAVLGEYDDGSAVFDCREPVRIISAVECLVDDPISAPEGRLNGSERRLPM